MALSGVVSKVLITKAASGSVPRGKMPDVKLLAVGIRDSAVAMRRTEEVRDVTTIEVLIT